MSYAITAIAGIGPAMSAKLKALGIRTTEKLLELAATALFLAREGFSDPWSETARRKPDKAEGGRLDKSKQLYQRLRQVQTPRSLPAL